MPAYVRLILGVTLWLVVGPVVAYAVNPWLALIFTIPGGALVGNAVVVCIAHGLGSKRWY